MTTSREQTVGDSPVDSEPCGVHLIGSRPATRRLQAVGVRQDHPAVHGAAPARLRAGADEGGLARSPRPAQREDGQPRPGAREGHKDPPVRIALGRETVAKLTAYRVVAEERAAVCGTSLRADDFLFSASVDGGAPWRPDPTTHRFIRARRRAGLPEGLRLHDLRHFLATRMISCGIDVRTVSGRLGHRRTSTTTDRYAAFVPAADRAAAAAFEEAFLS